MENWFKKRRRDLKLSQYTLAKDADVHPGTIALWERFRLIPSTPMSRLAELYQVPVAVIEKQLIVQRREVERGKAERELATAGTK